MAALLAGALSCSHDDIINIDPGESFDVTAKNGDDLYRIILSALRGGKWYQACIIYGGRGTLVYNDGSRVSFSDSDLKIYAGAMNLRKVGSDWYLDGVKTGVKVSEDTSLDRRKMICARRADGRLSIYLDNGQVLHLVSKGADLLDNVELSVSSNPYLSTNISFKKNGRSFSATAPSSTDAKSLALSFDFYGKTLTCGSQTLESGQTSIDLSSPVTLRAEAYDGSKYDFDLTLEVGGSGTGVRIGSMPAVYITTENGRKIDSKEVYVKGEIKFVDSDRWYSEVESLDVSMQIRGRGQTSWNMPKKPYRIKLDESSKVFGMPSNKDWVLIANYSDKTLLRNSLGFRLSEICGMAWTPLYRAVDVYLNGTYNGSYILVQHKEVAGKKVNIKPIAPDALSGEALTGDYYVEIESSEFDFSSPSCYNTELYGVPFQFKDPEVPEPEQREYFKNQVRAFEQRLKQGRYSGEDSYKDYIDVESFVNNYIIQEIAKNIDGNMRKSTYLTKEKGRKLRVYHVWDFDIAFGNCNYMHTEFGGSGVYGDDPTTWFIKDVGMLGKGKGWYVNMFKDPEFVSAVKKRWQELYPRLKEATTFLDEEASVNRESYNRNFEKWKILGTYVWPNPVAPDTYDGELEVLKSFYTRRVEWMNSEISKW